MFHMDENDVLIRTLAEYPRVDNLRYTRILALVMSVYPKRHFIRTTTVWTVSELANFYDLEGVEYIENIRIINRMIALMNDDKAALGMIHPDHIIMSPLLNNMRTICRLLRLQHEVPYSDAQRALKLECTRFIKYTNLVNYKNDEVISMYNGIVAQYASIHNFEVVRYAAT